jgi:hypothetical protein
MGLPDHTLLLKSAVHSTDEWFKSRLIHDLKLSRRLNLMNLISSVKWGAHREADTWLHRVAPSGEGMTGYLVGVRSYIYIYLKSTIRIDRSELKMCPPMSLH